MVKIPLSPTGRWLPLDQRRTLEQSLAGLTWGVRPEKWSLVVKDQALILLMDGREIRLAVAWKPSPASLRLHRVREAHPDVARVWCPLHRVEGPHFAMGRVAVWDPVCSTHCIIRE